MAPRNLDFVSVDVETANSKYSSICQIGIVIVRSGRIEDVWSRLIDPETDFGYWNKRIHGIDESMVYGAPTFKEIYSEIASRLSGIVVSHSSFDKSAISQACELHRKPAIRPQWLDSVTMARRAWPGRPSYKLDVLAQDLGITLRHHDASEDAKAAAKIALRVCADTNTNMTDWL